MAVRPADLTMQVLVTGAGKHRTRRVERTQQSRRFLVNVAIQLFRVTLPQPLERLAPGWIGVDRVGDDRWMVVPQVHQLLGLGQDRVTEKSLRASVPPVDVRADQWQILP